MQGFTNARLAFTRGLAQANIRKREGVKIQRGLIETKKTIVEPH